MEVTHAGLAPRFAAVAHSKVNQAAQNQAQVISVATSSVRFVMSSLAKQALLHLIALCSQPKVLACVRLLALALRTLGQMLAPSWLAPPLRPLARQLSSNWASLVLPSARRLQTVRFQPSCPTTRRHRMHPLSFDWQS